MPDIHRSICRIAPDKRVYDVASDLSAQGGTLEEVFRQIPGVVISATGHSILGF